MMQGVQVGVRVLFLSLWVSGTAHAFDAQAFSPAVDPEGYFSLYSSRTEPAGRYHLAVWYNWAKDPVKLRDPDFGTLEVDEIHTVNFVGSYSLTDWFELGIDVPISDVSGRFTPSGEDGVVDSLFGNLLGPLVGDDGVPPEIKTGIGIDDVRLLGKFQFLRGATPFGLGMVTFIEFPTGDKDRLTSNGKFDYGAFLVGDYHYQRFRTSLNAGYRVNNKPFDGSDEPDEILLGLGAGLLVLKDRPILGGLFDNVEAMAEIFGSTSEQKPFNSQLETPFEFLAGFRWFSPWGLYATTGAGRGITDGVNSPDLRIVASVGYTPPPPPPAPPPPPPTPPPAPKERVVVTDEQIVPLEPIHFDFDKATIRPESEPILDEVAEVMDERPSIHVRVEGHTDSVGSLAYNQALSERRAQAAVRYLVSKGIAPDRLSAVGHGETRPVATNETKEGRQKNRRTEFHIRNGPSGSAHGGESPSRR